MKVLTPLYARARLAACFFTVFAVLAVFSPLRAQDQAPATAPPARFETQARAADSATLTMAGSRPVSLWAVEKVPSQGAAFDLRARTALDNAIGQAKVVCEVKTRGADGSVAAQCTNGQDQDLGLFMLQQGFVTVDRAAVYGTVFEDAYVQAEMQAQGRGMGVWGGDSQGSTGSGAEGDGVYMVSFGFILFICIIVAFTIISVIIMRGFQKVMDAQNQNIDMMERERKLRDKERGIVAIMLDTELKANKAKIEAYCVVYDEMLKSLKATSRQPKYKKAGDIIQKQPALVRSVFDRNTDKLDMLGGQLSSELVHFYARIKTNPEYVTLEPTTPVEEAVSILETALKSARRLDELATKLLESFANSGIVSENYRE